MKNILDLTRELLVSNGDVTIPDQISHEAYLNRQSLQLRKKLDELFGNIVGQAIYIDWYNKMTKCHYDESQKELQYNIYGHLSHYHGFAHVLGAAIRAMNSFPLNMSSIEKKSSLLAIMYHDARHSMGYSDDFQNVIRAISPFTNKIVKNVLAHPIIGTRNYGDYVVVCGHDFCMDLIAVDAIRVTKSEIVRAFGSVIDSNTIFKTVIQGIQYTQWPYFQGQFSNLEPCLEHVRRIDLSSSSDEDWFQQIYEGLYYEIVKPSEVGTGFLEFCENQIKFLRSVQYFYYYETSDTLVSNKWKNVYDKMISRAHATLNAARKVTSL